MSDKKSPIQATITLQNGMFCHLLNDHFLISRLQNPDEIDWTVDLSKTSDQKKTRIIFNIIFTLVFVAAAFLTKFYPLILLLFLSLWDLRQLKRYQVPINKAKLIPIKNITEIKLKKGQMGFNYMDVFISNENAVSFVPLQLYDSESALAQAKIIAQHIGKLSDSPEIEKVRVTGYEIHLNETSSYTKQGDAFVYTQNHIFDKSRTDSYEHLRPVAFLLIVIVVTCIGVKINIMLNSYSNYIDYIVVGIFSLLLQIPIKYTRKSLPNIIKIDRVIRIKKDKNKTFIYLRANYGIVLKVHLKNQYLPSDFEEQFKLN